MGAGVGAVVRDEDQDVVGAARPHLTGHVTPRPDRHARPTRATDPPHLASNIDDLGEEHSHRVQRMVGNSTKGVLIPLPRQPPRPSTEPMLSATIDSAAFYTVAMFTLEQITDIHDRLGSRDTLVDYLHALRGIGVETYDSFVADGHSEYFGVNGRQLVGPAFHEAFTIADTCDKERFLQYMQEVEQGGIGYVEMSRALADQGVEKWTFDTARLTITYFDKAGRVLLDEKVE
jgi:uncharacterized protein YbcV (DUF1398 family)